MARNNDGPSVKGHGTPEKGEITVENLSGWQMLALLPVLLVVAVVAAVVDGD